MENIPIQKQLDSGLQLNLRYITQEMLIKYTILDLVEQITVETK